MTLVTPHKHTCHRELSEGSVFLPAQHIAAQVMTVDANVNGREQLRPSGTRYSKLFPPIWGFASR
jgi:hypothetical protein